MASTLNPRAPVWLPTRNDTKTSTPSNFSYHAAPFVPEQHWPFQEFHSMQGYYDTYYPVPHAQHYFYPPPPPYQEWGPASMEQFHNNNDNGDSNDNDSPINPQDPFARQLRQVENLRAGGYYPVMGYGNGEEEAWGGAKKGFKKGRKGKKGGKGWERKKRDERREREREERKDSGVAVDGDGEEGAKE